MLHNLKLKRTDKVVVLTGSGISKASGISTYRDKEGVWQKYDSNKVCTVTGVQENKTLAWKFFQTTYADLNNKSPNAAHYALVDLERFLDDGNFTLITQNIDGLHNLAGSINILEMHGNYKWLTCTCRNNSKYKIEDYIFNDEYETCHSCGKMLRPSVVMFGEYPLYKQEILKRVNECDYFVEIGTSGEVFPAAKLKYDAYDNGATVIIINMDECDNSILNDRILHYKKKAEEFLPEFINCLIN